MNDILQNALRTYYFEVKSKTSHFQPSSPFSPPFFWGEKTAAGFGAAAVGVVDRRAAPVWSSGVFSSRFRALIMAKRQPLASALASTATRKDCCAVIKPPGRDVHMPSPSQSSAGAGAPKSQAEVLEPFFPKNGLGEGGAGGGNRRAGGLANSRRASCGRMYTLSKGYN